MLVRGFWENLEKPIIGLSPMDGVTDAAFRYIVCKYSKPSLTMTEFTNVEGLARGSFEMLKAFLYCESERPVVAQIFGVETDSYYKATVMLAAMGFDGVDINMGCPCNKVARKGSGAGLIQTPELAKDIIRSCKKGAKDWAEGITMKEAGVHEDIIKRVLEINAGREFERFELPISVKTRIGFDSDVAEEWTKHILEELPANLSMHGRTLRQMYMGKADWEVIGKAARVCDGSGVSFLGNGDVADMEDALKKTADYGLDGVLVGRATFGNPWFFGGKEDPSIEERFEVLKDHAEYFQKLGHLPFHAIKKHLAWYCKEFSGARELRKSLMQVEGPSDVEKIIDNFEYAPEEAN
jgi:nifR3 family TIM-barrel protein